MTTSGSNCCLILAKTPLLQPGSALPGLHAYIDASMLSGPGATAVLCQSLLQQSIIFAPMLSSLRYSCPRHGAAACRLEETLHSMALLLTPLVYLAVQPLLARMFTDSLLTTAPELSTLSEKRSKAMMTCPGCRPCALRHGCRQQ